MEKAKSDSLPIELSSVQRLIWYGQQSHAHLPIYNAAYSFRLPGAIDRAAFERAHGKLVTHTDSFRITFHSKNGKPQQELAESPIGTLEVRETSPENETEFEQLLRDEASSALELGECPWRSILYLRPDGSSVWLLIQHHLLTDGVAFQILFDRMASLYEGETSERPNVNAPRFPSYADWLSSKDNDHVYKESPNTAAQRKDRSRLYSSKVPTGSPMGDRRCMVLDEDTRMGLAELSQHADFASFSRELSLNFILLTSYFALLSRIEQSEKVCIGIAQHGRRTHLSKNTAGAFVEIRPLSIEIHQTDTFSTLYETVREAYFQLASSSPEADGEQTFDVTFSFLSGGFRPFAGSRVEANWIYPGCHESANRWRIHFMESADSKLTLISDTNDEAFSQNARYTATQNLIDTIKSFIVDPNERIASYRLVQSSHLSGSILRGRDLPPLETNNIWRAFEATAGEIAHRAAIRADKNEVTYEALFEKARDLSAAIHNDTGEANLLVPIIGQRSIAMIEASLSALRAGRAFLPIDSATPAERIQNIIGDSQSAYVINLDLGLPGADGRTAPFQFVPAQIAYVIYTSGTTSIPNGVMVGHNSVLNLLEEMESRAPLDKGSNCMWWTAVSFDVSIYEVFSSLLYGHTLCIPPENIRLDSDKLFPWMEEQRINSAYLPPFMLEHLNDWLDTAPSFHLKRLLVGVEPIQEDVLISIARKVCGLKIVNGYGPTEATVCSTFYSIDPQQNKNRKTPIGSPLARTRCYVLDQNREPVPQGCLGELYIAGEGLSSGYWRRPELTNERFVPDLFPHTSRDAKMYKTGDRVRVLDEGELEFIGRVDSQIKLRGSRVEPGEIEQTISSYPGIRRSVVTLRRISNQDEIICFYTSAAPLDEQALHAHAAQHLPFQMLPKLFQRLESIPITINGKIDFEKLPAPQEQDSRPFLQPDGPLEERIASILRESLHIDSVSATHTFFELGGSSLAAMETMLKLCREFDVDLPLQTIFRHPTIKQLATVFEDALLHSLDELSEEEAARLLGEYDS